MFHKFKRAQTMKFRYRCTTGSKNPTAKLTESKVKYIKAQFGIKTDLEIANEFRVSEGTIRHIRLGYTWNHVKKSIDFMTKP